MAAPIPGMDPTDPRFRPGGGPPDRSGVLNPLEEEAAGWTYRYVEGAPPGQERPDNWVRRQFKERPAVTGLVLSELGTVALEHFWSRWDKSKSKLEGGVAHFLHGYEHTISSFAIGGLALWAVSSLRNRRFWPTSPVREEGADPDDATAFDDDYGVPGLWGDNAERASGWANAARNRDSVEQSPLARVRKDASRAAGALALGAAMYKFGFMPFHAPMDAAVGAAQHAAAMLPKGSFKEVATTALNPGYEFWDVAAPTLAFTGISKVFQRYRLRFPRKSGEQESVWDTWHHRIGRTAGVLATAASAVVISKVSGFPIQPAFDALHNATEHIPLLGETISLASPGNVVGYAAAAVGTLIGESMLRLGRVSGPSGPAGGEETTGDAWVGRLQEGVLHSWGNLRADADRIVTFAQLVGRRGLIGRATLGLAGGIWQGARGGIGLARGLAGAAPWSRAARGARRASRGGATPDSGGDDGSEIEL